MFLRLLRAEEEEKEDNKNIAACCFRLGRARARRVFEHTEGGASFATTDTVPPPPLPSERARVLFSLSLMGKRCSTD